MLSSAAVSEGSEIRPYYQERYETLQTGISGLLEEAVDMGDGRPDVDCTFEASALLAFLDGLRLQYFYSEGAVSISVNLATYIDQLVDRISPHS